MDSHFIELLVVIVILAILAAIVVFSVAGVQDRGKQSRVRHDSEDPDHGLGGIPCQ